MLLELIMRSVRKVKVQRGETLVTHLCIPVDCWFIGRGVAMEFIYDDMGQKTPQRFFREEPVIPAGFVEQRSCHSTTQMLTSGTVLNLRYEELSRLLNQNAEANQFFRLILADYAQRNRQREELLTLSIGERIRHLHEKQQRLILTVPGKYLARYLNMSPFTYSREKNNPRKK